MTFEELGNRVKQKFNAYADQASDFVGRKVTEAYPVYKEFVQEQVDKATGFDQSDFVPPQMKIRDVDPQTGKKGAGRTFKERTEPFRGPQGAAQREKFRQMAGKKTPEDEKQVQKEADYNAEFFDMDPEEFNPIQEHGYVEPIVEAFGDEADKAMRTLRYLDGEGVMKGENVNLETDFPMPNRDEQGNIEYVVNPMNGQLIPSIDRGLFRINNITFYDFMNRHPSKLQTAGITKWDDMADPMKSIKMAKIIRDEQGWNWHAAPPEFRYTD